VSEIGCVHGVLKIFEGSKSFHLTASFITYFFSHVFNPNLTETALKKKRLESEFQFFLKKMKFVVERVFAIREWLKIRIGN